MAPFTHSWLGAGSSGRTGSAVETSGSKSGFKLGFELWAQLGLCPLGESDVAVAQPLLCLKLCRAGLVQGEPGTEVVLREEEVESSCPESFGDIQRSCCLWKNDSFG